MTKLNSTPMRRVTTSTTNSAAADLSPDNEASGQQLMVFNYVLYEALDAMERERATSRHRPLHQSWQHFVYQLRLKKPKLGTCLDNWLRDGFFDEQGGAQ